MTTMPAIDYTNKDYASLRQAMLDLARYRLPEWTDQSPADLGSLLVDLFAYMGDVILYYQDRIANELFLPTATERRSVLMLLRLIGYELQPPVAAAADLTLTFKPVPNGQPSTLTIPTGAQFATKPTDGSTPQLFEYLGPPRSLDLASAQVTARSDGKLVYGGLPLRQSESVPLEAIGSSTGEPNQRFPLSRAPVILDSLDVQVDAGAGFVSWDRRDNLLYHTDPEGRVTLSGAASTDYYLQFDENGGAWVVFGDGQYGMRPPVGTNNVRARYRVGGGAAGNVPAGAIVEARTTIRLLDGVTNPAAAAGGADRESVEHAARFGPLAFRSGARAVTLNDFVSLAHQAGGVAKVRARSRGWNQIDLFIAPEGDTCRPAPDDLKKRLVAYFEDKRMVGTFIHIQDPTCVPVDVSVAVVSEYHYDPETVRQAVVAALGDLLAFRNVDFARPLYLSKIYEAVEAIPGVYAANVSRFRRQDSALKAFEARLGAFGVPGLGELPTALRRAVNLDVEADGRIEIGEFEIATPGELVVTVEEVVR
ncbi:MAG TPA: putative baseplate assembly protein [Chloroflexota bacterium]|jgi:hypothetical protein